MKSPFEDSVLSLTVYPRNANQTKGQIRALRLSGRIPSVLYGQGPSENISVCAKNIAFELEKPGIFSRVFQLPNYGKVLISAIQFCSVKDKPIHVDFRRLSKDQKIKILVRIVFLNQDKSVGIKRGGALNIVHHHLEVFAPVDCIPEAIDVDLLNLDIGQTIHLESIQLPEGIQVLHVEKDEAIASIVPPSSGDKTDDQEVSEAQTSSS
ncbi:50S ribosomal protein L25 [Holospora obtusa F1]|uniref:Large ribosomal subunit protein bL25 n=1 Tax=Holospora obtusa F1 TaxID=1399147 RepID=W6TFH8_HOLOB|nr:50S ribosomal protein L25/general stress protein Ctc [Holospora obtusa]ETZ06760.1 50S ribosomal protein L25 [Holospora obtusa F1]